MPLVGTAAMVLASGAFATTLQDLPRGARAGECFSRVQIAPRYRIDRQAVPQPAVVSWRDAPAVYRTVSRQVLVTPERVEHETIPAVMGSRMHWDVHPGPDRVVEVPPEYGWVEKRVMISPAHLAWRRGGGGAGNGEAAYGDAVQVQPTGEVMCRIRVPARYEVRRVRVLLRPGRTCVERGPSTRERIVEHFVVRPARVVEHRIPAVYRTVTERVLVSPARHDRIVTPQPPRFVEHRVMVTPARSDWRRITCAAPGAQRVRLPPAPEGTYGAYRPDYAPTRAPTLDGAPQGVYRAPTPQHD